MLFDDRTHNTCTPRVVASKFESEHVDGEELQEMTTLEDLEDYKVS